MKTLILALMLLASNCFAGDTGWLFTPLYTQGTNNPLNVSTAGNKGSLYFNTAASSVYIKLDDFPTTNWQQLNGSASTIPFARTCTLTSAAAATAVHCLAAGDVGTAQTAHVLGFKAKVNGVTSWGTVASCVVQDTNPTPVQFASVAVSALTNSAYITPTTSGVGLSPAFTVNNGATAGAGIDLLCNANGTGSNLVLTIEGYLH